MATSPQTFPGFYATIIDKSFAPVTLSQFRGGLIGVANKGPFNTPTLVNSLTEFSQKFGDSDITGSSSSDWKGQLAVAVASIADFSGSTLVVRIGHQYSDIGNVSSGRPAGTTILPVLNANQFSVGDYVRIVEFGVETTAGVQISAVDSANISIPATGHAYSTAATVSKSSQADSANKAEAFLDALDYLTNQVGGVSSTVSGSKNDFTLTAVVNLAKQKINTLVAASGTVTATTAAPHGYAMGDQVTISNVTPSSTGDFNGTYTLLTASGSSFTYTALTTFSGSGSASSGNMEVAALSAGDLIEITQTGKTDTLEVLVKSVVPASTGCTIYLYPSAVTSLGYQALPLQDTYTAGKIYKVKRSNGLGTGGAFNKTRVLHLKASSEGTWANSNPITNSNLVVQVGPGSSVGTKKLLVYYNTQLVETLDNLSLDSTSANYLPTYVTAKSSYVTVEPSDHPAFLVERLPANTLNGWNISNLGGQINVSNFTGGDNGANTDSDDWVGELDPATDLYTGIRSFQNESDYVTNVLSAPGATDTDIQQNLVATARKINAVAILDVEQSTVPRQYADYRNAVGTFSDRVKVDDWHGALFANWFDVIDPFTNDTRRVPPSMGVLRCMARTFNQEKPWYASAGEIRGFLDNAQSLQYRTINSGSKTQAYDSNVNLIVSNSSRIQVYGDRTLQVADSKLSELHVAILVNYIVASIGQSVRKFIFDPNDPILLSQINQSVTQFMDGIQNERGVEQYKLTVDGSNNNATTRNLREVIIDLAIVPVSTAEKIFLNLTVNRSGAQLNS